MKLRAQKLSGLGNIIVIIDLISQKGEISSETVKRITNKNKITFDQLISIKPPIRPDNDLEVDIFNRDASEAENCVNGARCLAKFIFEKGLIPKKSLLVGTKGGVWTLRSHNKNVYSVKITKEKLIKNIEILINYFKKIIPKQIDKKYKYSIQLFASSEHLKSINKRAHFIKILNYNFSIIFF